jgi:hypothetical protein
MYKSVARLFSCGTSRRGGKGRRHRKTKKLRKGGNGTTKLLQIAAKPVLKAAATIARGVAEDRTKRGALQVATNAFNGDALSEGFLPHHFDKPQYSKVLAENTKNYYNSAIPQSQFLTTNTGQNINPQFSTTSGPISSQQDRKLKEIVAQSLQSR